MSISTEITRLQNAKASIKSSIEAKGVTVPSSTTLDGYSTLIDSIPSGGGTTINGDLVNKTIQSGSISKGDFVQKGLYVTDSRVSSSNEYAYYTGVNISNAENLIDNDDNTYATIRGSGTMPRIYFDCKSRETLNIPSAAHLLSINCICKIQFYDSTTNSFGAIKYREDGVNRIAAGPKNYSSGLQTITFGALSDVLIPTDDTNRYGIQVYSGQNNKMDIYYVKFEIDYLYDGEIRKVTSDTDFIYGIANEDGLQGDTIEVYIPSTE